ncbi:alpha/beta hydrolase [Pararhodobacter oceanensis]|uniref:alpha/beta hydrolase n=1 Tax=Pararhodobacter oceanensis TaxID=2172121 RepID=UPI003A933329
MSDRQKHKFTRLPLIIQYPEALKNAETYGFVGTQGMVNLEGQLLRPEGVAAKTVLLIMHPATTLQLLPVPIALAEAGFHVICGNSRYARFDASLIMEKVARDMGAYIDHAKNVLGYEKVVLLGWSGGASLSLFYQSQAESPDITHTPAGDLYDLTQAGLIPADGVMMVAAHASRARTLSEWLDPSVIDESDPYTRDPELDIYDPMGAPPPPYSADFIATFRAAQLARMRRITAWARDELERLNAAGGAEFERSFVTHRTMADLRWLDPNVDPNDRVPQTCYLGNPEAANVNPVGIGRYSSLRSWLSQWSVDDSRCDAVVSAAKISVPLMVIENSADDGAPASHSRMVFEAAAQTRREMHVIKGATHYYKGQPEKLQECLDLISGWLAQTGLTSSP